jgi:hypothetical protein
MASKDTECLLECSIASAQLESLSWTKDYTRPHGHNIEKHYTSESKHCTGVHMGRVYCVLQLQVEIRDMHAAATMGNSPS